MSVYSAGEYGVESESTEWMDGKRDGVAPVVSVIEDGHRYGETLTTLLSNLQGLADDAVVGAGLARFSARRLIAIRHAAERKVDAHLHGMAALLQVMTLATRDFGDQLPSHVMPDITTHLQMQTQELACWRDLASQAAYMHEHPDFARQLALRYVQQTEISGEWPSA